MASSHKMIAICLSVMLISSSVIVEAGRHHQNNDLGTLITAGLIALLLKEGGESSQRSGGYIQGRSVGGHSQGQAIGGHGLGPNMAAYGLGQPRGNYGYGLPFGAYGHGHNIGGYGGIDTLLHGLPYASLYGL